MFTADRRGIISVNQVTHPLVSVIIPTYNSAPFLRETIDSVVNQSYDNVEIIVVDDGSTDDTTAIVASYDRSIILVTQENGGVSKARNHGMRIASGKYICFLDHDDVWHREKLAAQVSFAESNRNFGLIFTGFAFWPPGVFGQFIQDFPPFFEAKALDIENQYTGWIYHLLLIDSWILTSSAMIDINLMRRIGGFDESLPYSEDWDVWLRISRECEIAKLEYTYTLYRQHPVQGSRKSRPVDYRTELLHQATRKWGLASPNGASISMRSFKKNVARYHLLYARDSLIDGKRMQCLVSSVKALWYDPTYLKSLLYIGAAAFGVRPKSVAP